MAYRRELPDWKSEYLDPELETMSREQIEYVCEKINAFYKI